MTRCNQHFLDASNVSSSLLEMRSYPIAVPG